MPLEAHFQRTNRSRWEKEREQELRSAPMRVDCSACDWSFVGRAEDGIQAARSHRRKAHPELPVWTPQRRKRFNRPSKADAEMHQRILEVLRAADRPLRAGEIAAQIDDLSAYSVGAAMRFIKDAYQPRHGRWGLVGREFSDVEEPRPKQFEPNPELEAKRARVLRAIAELRDAGVHEATTAQVAKRADVHPIAAGKFLSSAGYRRVGESRWRTEPPTSQTPTSELS